MNAFKYCGHSDLPEANLAYQFWELDMAHLAMHITEKSIPLDIELTKVYFEWMDETCHNDLRSM